MAKELKMIRSGSLAMFRQKQWKRTVSFTLSERCNLNCEYCYVQQKNAHQGDLRLDFVKTVIDTIANRPDIGVLQFTGGEPTIYPHFLEVLEYAGSAAGGRILKCLTNGMTGSQYFIKILNINPDIQNVLSVHMQFYNERKVREVIETLAQFNTEQNINILFAPGSIDKSELILKLAKEAGNCAVHFLTPYKCDIYDLYYEYSPRELCFLRENIQKNINENFADFTDEDGTLYRLLGSPVEISRKLNLFKYFKGMYCSTCDRCNKIRNNRVYHLLCDYNNYASDDKEIRMFESAYRKCVNSACDCNFHTKYPKFSELKWAPVALGGEPALSVDAVSEYVTPISRDQIELRLKNGRPSYIKK